MTTWTKKSRKGRQKWESACMDNGLQPWRLKTFIETRCLGKVIMFEEILEFKVITLCVLASKKC
jgi:hypothetical protein